MKLLKNIDMKKSTGEDKLPSKPVKCAASYKYKSLTLIINYNLKTSTFPNNPKHAVVTPLDKSSLNKNNVNNFRPVSVLNCFSKIFENVIKGQLMLFILKINDLFSFLHIDHLIVHSMLICLIEEWRQKFDNEHFVGAVLMDLSKVFDCIPYDLLIAKLSAYGLSNEDLDYILLHPSGQK